MFCLCRPILERDIMMVCCWLILPITNRGKKATSVKTGIKVNGCIL